MLVTGALQKRTPVAGVEEVLRERLGIPAEARQVIIFGESSHWDPNWLQTSEGYFERHVGPVLDQVIDELERSPRRIYAVESVFFLRMYWTRRPQRRERLRALLDQGRLRLTGCGITTPDTLLPDTESLLRDYLLGQEWLRTHRIDVEPRMAYLPDCFGHSPALPSLLQALGIDRAAVTRIDGMHFVASDYRRRGAFPLPGSSAALLQRQLRTADFVWSGPDGAEILCHWNAFSYFLGDMLGHRGVVRWMDVLAGMPWRAAGHVARQIDGFVAQLAPLARTPYLFCPIGCDFVPPIPGLVELLDGYNERRFGDTGVFAVNAGLDDYLELVDCHRMRLPVVSLDPNPYWMGFYGSRPGMKRSCRRVAHALVRAEKLALLHGRAALSSLPAAAAWDRLAVANHHDYITGTSPDLTVAREQEPWLREAAELARTATAAALPGGAAVPRRHPGATAAGDGIEWRAHNGLVEVTTRHQRLVFAEEQGGCLVSCVVDGIEWLSGPANDLVAYHDTGGLWRLGHEFRGGSFRQVARASSRRGVLVARARRGGVLEILSDIVLDGRPIRRTVWVRGDEPALRMRVQGAAARRLTITCRFPSPPGASTLTMDVPGGLVERAARKLHDPTFWPASSFAHVRDPATGRGLAAFLGGPAAVSLDPDAGTLEWMVLRNAPHERAFGILPLFCHPIGGTDDQRHAIDYAVCFTPSGGVLENRLPALAARVLGDAWTSPAAPDLDALAATLVTCDCPDVLVGAVKPAHRGGGVIVRLHAFGLPRRVKLATARPVRHAWLCDARERDIAPLAVKGGEVALTVERAITSLRLEPG